MPARCKSVARKTAGTEKSAARPEPQPNTVNSATPLDYMLSVMRDPAVEPARRDEMAKLALPYMHPKVTAPEPVGQDNLPPEAAMLSDTDIARRIAFTLAKTMHKPVEH